MLFNNGQALKLCRSMVLSAFYAARNYIEDFLHCRVDLCCLQGFVRAQSNAVARQF